ncbi:class I SAM-dependent methyltransferase [Streptomyces sp. NPDC059568]|uniref:class I SAM-dependent methyltransferase n=1 Tax=Streptomyces sp. NPDC059568 TaxID=3346868 RepID=UPI00367827A9
MTARGPGTAEAPGSTLPYPAAWHEDPYADALRSGQGPLFLRRNDGWLLPLEVERWCTAPDTADLSVLARCEGSVLDVGCGPGRLVTALAARGQRALGIDVSPAAVARTEQLGGLALCRSVFEPLPGEGRWDTTLLIDGNIGIGGDPEALLGRLGKIVRRDGTVIVECLALDVDERCEVRLDNGRGGLGTPFAWARVGARALSGYAAAAGWVRRHQWPVAGRVFVELARAQDRARVRTPRGGPDRQRT